MIGDGVGGLRHVGIKKIHFVIAERPLSCWSSVSLREPGNLHKGRYHFLAASFDEF